MHTVWPVCLPGLDKIENSLTRKSLEIDKKTGNGV